MRKMRKCICKTCKNEYEVEDWRKPSSYCSRKCKHKKASTWLLKTSFQIGKATQEEKIKRLSQNYEKHVIRKEGCWDWKGKSEKGYPKMTCRKALGANLGHRSSWIIHKGSIPFGLSVLHSCDNKICTNPDHLFLGTNEDNVNDMLYKKRNPIGSKVGTAKLDESKVSFIKRSISSGISLQELAKKFDVTYQAIALIKNGKNWKHVEA